MIGSLPKTLTVNGREWAIATDYREILKVMVIFNDPELEAREKLFLCLYYIYDDFEKLNPDEYEEAYKQAVWFIDCGSEPKEGKNPRLMDWEQDEHIIFPAVNRVAGFEVRDRDYLHWWTFMGYFTEIHEGIFSQVLSLRQKKAKKKKLEKWEREFWSANKDLCVLKEKLTEEEKAAKDRLNALLNG